MFGCPGLFLAPLGPSWAALGRSWAALSPPKCSPKRTKNGINTPSTHPQHHAHVLTSLLATLGPLLGRSWRLLGRSWAALGRSWAALGSLLGRSWPLLGRSWPLLGLSWPLSGSPWGTKIALQSLLLAKTSISKNH